VTNLCRFAPFVSPSSSPLGFSVTLAVAMPSYGATDAGGGQSIQARGSSGPRVGAAPLACAMCVAAVVFVARDASLSRARGGEALHSGEPASAATAEASGARHTILARNAYSRSATGGVNSSSTAQRAYPWLRSNAVLVEVGKSGTMMSSRACTVPFRACPARGAVSTTASPRRDQPQWARASPSSRTARPRSL
jgi:hypothetical protein